MEESGEGSGEDGGALGRQQACSALPRLAGPCCLRPRALSGSALVRWILRAEVLCPELVGAGRPSLNHWQIPTAQILEKTLDLNLPSSLPLAGVLVSQHLHPWPSCPAGLPSRLHPPHSCHGAAGLLPWGFACAVRLEVRAAWTALGRPGLGPQLQPQQLLSAFPEPQFPHL